MTKAMIPVKDYSLLLAEGGVSVEKFKSLLELLPVEVLPELKEAMKKEYDKLFNIMYGDDATMEFIARFQRFEGYQKILDDLLSK